VLTAETLNFFLGGISINRDRNHYKYTIGTTLMGEGCPHLYVVLPPSIPDVGLNPTDLDASLIPNN
jgi:hypothetical protein